MKRLLILFAILTCFAIGSSASAISLIGSGITVAGCTTPSTGDEMNEGFNAAGYELGAAWTENVGAGDDIDEDHTLQASAPGGCCTSGTPGDDTEGIRVYASESDSDTYWDKGSTFDRSGDLDVKFYLYINSMTLDNFSTTTIVSWDTDTGTPNDGMLAYIQIVNANGYYLSAYGTDESTKASIATGTWYTVTLHMDGGTTSDSYFKIDEVETCDAVDECKFTRRDTADGRYLAIAADQLGAGESVDYEIAYIYVNSP